MNRPGAALPAGAVAIELVDTTAWLLPHKAIYLPQHAALLAADVHIGKAVSFRRLGVPVPEATTDETLGRLSAALAVTAARRLIFLGDLLHSARSLAPGTLAALQAWREAHAQIDMLLVRGNHDAHAGDPPAALRIPAVDGPQPLGPFALVHAPDDAAAPERYRLCGHVHPAVSLGGRANDTCACRVFTSAPKSACCRPLALSPAPMCCAAGRMTGSMWCLKTKLEACSAAPSLAPRRAQA